VIRILRQFDPQAIRLLIFDLDGTLIDSRLDLIHSINAMLRHMGRPELPGELIATYVGDGAPTLVRRALQDAVDEPMFQSALDYFLAYYREHKLDHTTVYAGIPEALAGIAVVPCGAGIRARAAEEAGPIPVHGSERPQNLGFSRATVGADKSVRPTQDVGATAGASDAGRRLMAVLSNKPVRPSRDIVEALGLGRFFVRVYGGNSFETKKPDPLGARTIMEETGIGPEETMIVGDSAIDVQTGRNAGLWTGGVTYGFAPHTLNDTPPDVLIDTPTELIDLLG
jgi:phosphoglycolate phosphatase